MLNIAQVRGAILEEIVLSLLEKAGYRVIETEEDGDIKIRGNKLTVKGRGEWHQIDAFVAYDYTPAFIYPIRLGVEAKAHFGGQSNGQVGIDVVRNAVGVLKDLNENYFSHSSHVGEAKVKRYNYTYAIFSLNGFSANAQRYALAHQIYLIQYNHNMLFDGIRELLKNIILIPQGDNNDPKLVSEPSYYRMRMAVRRYFRNSQTLENTRDVTNIIEYDSIRKIKDEIETIGGSYFGLLNGYYPIHLTSTNLVDLSLYSDSEQVKIYVTRKGIAKIKLGDIDLIFDLPIEMAKALRDIWGNPVEVVGFKKRYISFVTVTGIFNNIRRNVRLNLDTEWLDAYISKKMST